MLEGNGAYVGNTKRNSEEVCRRVRTIEKQLNWRITAAYEKEIWDSFKEMKAICMEYEEEIRILKKRCMLARQNNTEDAVSICKREIKRTEELLSACRQMDRMPILKKWLYVKVEARISRRRFGDCHHLWEIKKRILREEYGIDWYTPQEERPYIRMD